MLKNNRGIALLLTVTITTLSIAVCLELNRQVRSAVVATAYTRDQVTLTQMTAAGINAAMAMLVHDKEISTIDSIQEDWANPEKIDELLKGIPFEDGNISLRIKDELMRIQVNALVTGEGGRQFNEPQRLMWERLLEWYKTRYETLNEIDPPTIINSLKDWIDSGDDDAITGLSGAESEYYQDLAPPYSSRNGPIKHPGELTRIKGITPELLYGDKGRSGLIEHITVYGIQPSADSDNIRWLGKININTAELPVLIALLPYGADDLAQAMVDFRNEKDGDSYSHDLSSPTWYRNVPGLGDIEIDPALITLSSDIFRIVASATLNDMKMKVTAVVLRTQHKETGKWICRVLSWESESE
ncbi:MAG: general secretion pathway protein GspK [Deltaproteobacteria bacterium]|nr:general secretion pathway protein GspK [Deltaproteobacteria bacterium]MBW2151920.1 general secretion pathway protein GspK [Deltaproteobacteria bacterium]